MIWLYWIYYVTAWIITPCLPLYSKWRVQKGKDDGLRYPERFGRIRLPRPTGPVLWVHAASMGESQSVLPLVKQWLITYPDLHIVFTTVTTTSAQFVATRLPDRAVHQYAPYDTPLAIRRFLRHWQPDMVCFVDSEIWPNTIRAVGQRDIPFVLINGRISDRSTRRWHRVRGFCEYLLRHFSCIYAKSEEDATRFRNLGAQHVLHYGNIKFSTPPLQANAKQLSELLSEIGNRPVWLASSTHDGEEVMIADIHRALAEDVPNLLTIIVPRHSTRGDDICQQLKTRKLVTAQRSAHEAITDDCDIYVADTMGELGIFYRIAGITFVGGSLVPHGGQNPFEPAKLNCAVLYGPHMQNFREFCSALESAAACIVVQDKDALAEAVNGLLRDQQQQEALASAALSITQDSLGVVERLVDDMRPWLDAINEIDTSYARP